LACALDTDGGDGKLTTAIYRTTVTHNRQAPVRHSFKYRSYSWYIDLDDLPSLPWWLRPFARFDARDHFIGRPGESLRDRVDAYLTDHDAAVPGGRITALLQPRVLGYVFNPISIFWCHDRAGVLHKVIVEVHNTYGQRHAYLLPPASTPVRVSKKLYVSPFNPVSGHYQVRAPRPDEKVDVVISLHGEGQSAFVATLRGTRRPATVRHVARMQIVAPLAPLMVALRIRIQGIALWLRRVPVVPRTTDVSETLSATIDPERWPAVAKVPSGPVAVVSAFIADRLLRRIAGRLPLRLAYPDGTVIGAGNAAAPMLKINRPDQLARRIGRHGLIGFGESYMAGEWESDALTPALTTLATEMDSLVPRSLQWLRPVVVASQPHSSQRSRRQARQDIAAHYDLSNDLFGEFLDETMSYSSALFPSLPASWPSFADAQRRKIDRLLDATNVGPGTELLEIGTGWGELCIRAAARGANVRSVTLSERQQWLARQRVAAAGVSDRVHIDLRDYRDLGGNYDAVISVEMIEAIGFHAWTDYFRTLEQLLTPNGRLAIQAITMSHNRMMATRNTHTWIQKYIFPGGLIPSAEAILDITERETRLRPVDMLSLRQHYAETLRLWRERFMERRKTLSHIGFDEVFARMWELYLSHAEAGFRSGYLDVYQWTFVNKAAT
jgi:cyclopropane-fatty-acyl-phospholipid synthase